AGATSAATNSSRWLKRTQPKQTSAKASCRSLKLKANNASFVPFVPFVPFVFGFKLLALSF
ncbi:MAG: hypothetical protein J5743_08220, partial [Victivallales bacterium]|nr:hypothetical protein [Victivallales bacterium]